jgi:hypothetical protein
MQKIARMAVSPAAVEVLVPKKAKDELKTKKPKAKALPGSGWRKTDRDKLKGCLVAFGFDINKIDVSTHSL